MARTGFSALTTASSSISLKNEFHPCNDRAIYWKSPQYGFGHKFLGMDACFIQKMLGRTSNVNDVAISLTVVPDLFPLMPWLIEERRATGIVNFVNQGAVKLSTRLDPFHSVLPVNHFVQI